MRTIGFSEKLARLAVKNEVMSEREKVEIKACSVLR
jgi:hypothetical protein